ncbi:peptidoglycan-associated lipoprotein Pal [Oceanidesulfovibrio marinus]|uniref:Peptidoglycan-associated lipoprotein n=2 Tax=Oceanidesulfovibrio marinus TaxID=370038 RepID=A0A6P1ZKM3_9BACT|nr:peptidoglycan-associated lipoprotein Pal [Oceanidesulfovibrio marinus]QJT10652.1 peptidoglycan-associated lipoprotein Pal [Oceanidesulfovibrio marinus]TVM34120.1 peptidoglycan-associated lipoprotein Pal [Oceanidesulfovibrio marinus]
MRIKQLSVFALFVCLAFLLSAGCAKQQVAPAGGTEGSAGMNQSEFEARNLSESQRIVLSEKIYFAFDSFELSPEARAVLDRKAQLIRTKPNLKVLIEGHCDERGTQEYNLALGERRAKAAEKYLVMLGVPTMQIETVSYGEERPAVIGHNENAWAQNRRDEFQAVW